MLTGHASLVDGYVEICSSAQLACYYRWNVEHWSPAPYFNFDAIWFSLGFQYQIGMDRLRLDGFGSEGVSFEDSTWPR